MTRFLLTLLAAQLVALASACGSAPSGLAPDAAYRAGVQAIEANDADRAVQLFTEAGDAGHLEALRQLTRAYKHGALSASWQPDAPTLYDIRLSARRAERLERAYHRALADSVEAGVPSAILWSAIEEMGVRMYATDRDDLPPELREQHWDRVDVDAVRALYARLDAAEFDGWERVELARLGHALDDTDGAIAILDQMIADGNSSLCAYKVALLHGPFDAYSAAGLANGYDRMAECSGQPPEAGALSGVRESARNGAARSVEVLDSLETLGLFERYPHLAAATP